MWKYLLFLASVHLLGRLPTRVLYVLAAVAGDLAYLFARHLRRNVWDNMRHVMGPNTPKKVLRKAARQVFRNTAKYYADLIRLPHLNVQKFFDQRLIYHGLDENILPALSNGKGVIITSAHFGNPILAIQGLLPKGLKATVLTERLQPPALSRLVDSLRSSQGHTFLPVSFSSVKLALRTLKAGGVVGVMCDRDIEGRSLVVPFCGTPTSMPLGAVDLAMRTGAALIPVFSYRRNGGAVEVFLEPPLEMIHTGDPQADLKTNVRRLLEHFEPHLQTDPGQWTVMEAVWEGERETDES
ncbi:MAG: lysophospholipid acyltransferase family protein [Chloroflexota bacterium]|nr:lysophospholipid acyltransferase family protein [Chloroflexota bacterium]